MLIKRPKKVFRVTAVTSYRHQHILNFFLYVDREQFLIKQHDAEIKAMTKVQVDQTNDNLDIIFQLEQENQLLRRQLGQPLQQITLHHPTSTTSQLCNNAEVKRYMSNILTILLMAFVFIDCKQISA